MGNNDEEFQIAGPAAGAEEMFKDDPEMLKLIAQGRKEQAGPNPRRKPVWWTLFITFLVIAGGAAGCIPLAINAIDVLPVVLPFHVALPASWAFGGGLLGVGILGHRMGSFVIRDNMGRELERATLWTPIPLIHRILVVAVALILPVLGLGVTVGIGLLN